jgi:hypothetical protein
VTRPTRCANGFPGEESNPPGQRRRRLRKRALPYLLRPRLPESRRHSFQQCRSPRAPWRRAAVHPLQVPQVRSSQTRPSRASVRSWTCMQCGLDIDKGFPSENGDASRAVRRFARERSTFRNLQPSHLRLVPEYRLRGIALRRDDQEMRNSEPLPIQCRGPEVTGSIVRKIVL